MLRASENSELYYGIERIKNVEHVCLLLNKVLNNVFNNDMHETKYDPGVTPRTVNDYLFLWNKEM